MLPLTQMAWPSPCLSRLTEACASSHSLTYLTLQINHLLSIIPQINALQVSYCLRKPAVSPYSLLYLIPQSKVLLSSYCLSLGCLQWLHLTCPACSSACACAEAIR